MPAIRTIALYVQDPQRSKLFYSDLLGLPLTAEHAGRVELDAAGTRVLLHPTDTDEQDHATARHGRIELYLDVTNVDATLAHLASAGIAVIQEPTTEPWGERDAGVLDPDGFAVFLTQSLS